MSSEKTVLASFHNAEHARNAVYQLETAGVRSGTISVLMSDPKRNEFARIDKHTKAPEGAAVGGAAGVAVGALIAGLTAVAGIAVPGIGFFAAGPLVAALAGAGAGGAAGGAVGGLVGLGITEHEAKFHTSVLREGGYVVSVTTSDKSEYDNAKAILDKLGVRSETAKGSTAQV